MAVKLIVLAPSAQYLASAGNRIRYQRLREPLARSGCMLSIASVGQTGKELEVASGDVVLFSKVQDARSVGLARDLRANGIHVGVDLFDDYFSQTADARFAPQRLWLAAMAGSISFFLCSTKRMQAVAQGTLRDVPGFVLNDPFERFEVALLAQTIEARRVAALERGVLDILWFGMGDNPSFPIGLHDLTQFGYLLGDLARQGFAVNLTVLTNSRALDARGLALLRQLPVDAKVEEWSHNRESELLGSSLISFVPVNGQPFSIAKSLNRAVTALTAGTQVLTAGYPLYDVLESFCYTDPAGLAEDLRRGELRVSASSLAALGEKLNEISNPVSEARALHAFLAALPAAGTEADLRPLAILHGGTHKHWHSRLCPPERMAVAGLTLYAYRGRVRCPSCRVRGWSSPGCSADERRSDTPFSLCRGAGTDLEQTSGACLRDRVGPYAPSTRAAYRQCCESYLAQCTSRHTQQGRCSGADNLSRPVRAAPDYRVRV